MTNKENRGYLSEVQVHILAVCKEAGLDTMAEIIGIIQDREEVEDATLLTLTPDDITLWYEVYIGPATDRIEDELLGREGY